MGTSQVSRTRTASAVSRGEDVTLEERQKVTDDVRTEFNDIFKVNSNCDYVKVDIAGYSDSIDVAGSLSDRSSVEFFETLGASEFVLKTLREGHHPSLISEVPSFEKRNNRSYYENKDFPLVNCKLFIAPSLYHQH